MSVRLVGALVGAVAVGAIVVACSGNEPTRPSPSGLLRAVVNSGCTPDVQAPTITSVSASPNVLWPPNHKMQTVTLHWGAVDNCGSPMCAISSISSNEPVNGRGDGNTSPDWVITSNSTADLLRAERSGNGTGRIYTITVSCLDAAGNKTVATTTVLVPHDQGKNLKCPPDDKGKGDDKNGDRDMKNKCEEGDDSRTNA